MGTAEHVAKYSLCLTADLGQGQSISALALVTWFGPIRLTVRIVLGVGWRMINFHICCWV